MTQAWTQRWPIISEVEMSAMTWYTILEEIQRLRDIGMLSWNYDLRSAYPPWKVQRTYISPQLWRINLCGKSQILEKLCDHSCLNIRLVTWGPKFLWLMHLSAICWQGPLPFSALGRTSEWTPSSPTPSQSEPTAFI